MDASIAETNFTYDGHAPLLVAASSEAAYRRAREVADAAGARIAHVDIENARERLKQQASLSAIWIGVDRDCGEVLDGLLEDVDAMVEDRRAAAVVSITSGIIDTIGPRLFNTTSQIIVDAGPVERAASLATATALARSPERASDVSRDPGTERLRQLSDEVGRIAATLARLSTIATPEINELRKPVEQDVPDVAAETVRSVIRARRLRDRFFANELFSDPAWDMLLDLLQAEITQLRGPISSLCIAAAIPATTALRWLKGMTEKGIFVRRDGPHDGRRVFVELLKEASVAMRRYFAEVGRPAVV